MDSKVVVARVLPAHTLIVRSVPPEKKTPSELVTVNTRREDDSGSMHTVCVH
jgi:hypothetical protein